MANEKLKRYFEIELNSGDTAPLVINVNQYDQSETWIFTTLLDGEIYKPSIASIIGIKSDKKGIINSASVNSDGQVVVNETKQMTASAGDCTYELQLDSTVHGTHNFIVRVEPKPADNADFSDSDVSLMQKAIESVEEAKGLIDEAEKATEEAKEATEEAKEATEEAKEAAESVKGFTDQIATNTTNISKLETRVGTLEDLGLSVVDGKLCITY